MFRSIFFPLCVWILAAGLTFAKTKDSVNTEVRSAWTDSQTKVALSGKLDVQVSYLGDIVTLEAVSKKRFANAAEKKKAVMAARLIQRDVARFCGTQCWAEEVPAPEWLANGHLRFFLRFSGLGRQLFQEELPALIQGQPMPQSHSAGRPAEKRNAKSVPKGKTEPKLIIRN